MEENDVESITWGLLACGRSGGTDVDLLEGEHADAQRADVHQLIIDREPDLYVYFLISGPAVVPELVRFLRSDFNDTKGESFDLGLLGGIPVELVRGSKCPESWKLLLLGPAGMLKLRLEPEAVQEILACLEQVVEMME